MFGTETGETTYTQWSIDGYATGDTFDLPAGPVGLAAGFQYRYDKMNDTPGEITYNPITGESNAWLDDAAGITTGDDTTWAVFAEVDVPILADKPAFRNLTLNASARYTNVDSYGSDTTWKVGLNWQLTDSIRLRGNRATSFRAPALYELYIANQTSYISQRSDPCIRYDEAYLAGDISQTVHDNCAADPAGLPPGTPPNYTDAYTGGTITPTVFTGGGAGLLEAETADSTTYGIIWQPSFANLSVSIDYFNFQVKGEVDRLGGSQIILGCYESHFGYASGGTEPLCDLFDRTNINKGIDNVMDSYINIANQENSGIDYAVRYIASVGPGDLTIDLRATQQKKDVRALFEETSEDLNGRVGDPEWVGQSAITYDSNKWSFFWGVDWIGPSSSEQHFGRDYVTYYTVNYDAVLYTDDVFYHSFSAQYRMDNGITLLAGIANAFDQHPPQLTRVQTTDEYTMVGNSLLASNYDMIGRRFFVNATWAFE